MTSALPKVYYPDLLPHEFRQRLADKPIAYLPMGTLEWHGEHLPLGSDAFQSEALMRMCAQELGGIVMPPIHLGPDGAVLMPDGQLLHGMDRSDSTTPHRRLEGSAYWVSSGFFKLLIDEILTQLKRAGFKAVFADGHGPSRWSWVDDLPSRERRFGLKLFGVTPDIKDVWPSMMDHAAHNETSIMLAVRPDLVDMSHLPADPTVWPQGVKGADPRQATAEYGAACLARAVAIVKQKFADAGL